VRTITGFAGVDAIVAGKPEKPLMEETVLRVGGDRPLMVGDRLDTTSRAPTRSTRPSLLVLTGVTWLEELAAAPPPLRPTYISPTLAGPVRAASRAVGHRRVGPSSAAGPRASGTVG
jgi:ribonucleotide monophosphatase NagD (HAD superfamily)